MHLFLWISKWAQRASNDGRLLFYEGMYVEKSGKDGGSQIGSKMGKIGPEITPKRH